MMEVKSSSEVDDRKAGINANLSKQSGVKTKVILVSLIAIGLLGAVGYQFVQKGSAPKTPVASSDQAVLSVKLVAATLKPFSRKVLVSGTVMSWDPISVGSEVGGLKVDSVRVDEGQTVKRGQVLATLSSAILQAQLDREQARLVGANASLSKSIQPNRPEDLTSLRAGFAQSQAAVAQEEANLARAKANYQEAYENAERYKWLVKQGAVSAQEADARYTQAKVALADVHNGEEKVKAAKFISQQAHERMTMGVSGGRKEDVDISRAQKLEIEANIRQLRSQIEQTIVRSPCDGLISKRNVHLGDIASSTKTMFEIVRDNRLELRAQIPERDLDVVKPGQPVAMIGDNDSYKGIVREISPQVEQDTRLGTVRIDIPDAASRGLMPGNFLRGDILIGNQPVCVVPASCLVYKGNRAFVYLVEGDKTRMRFVQTGGREGQSVEITEGLKPGEKVVDKGAGFLKDGDTVRVLSD